MKRIALIVTSTAVFAASCGVGTAAVKNEVAKSTRGSAHVIEPYPAQRGRTHRLAPNTGYALLNPASPSTHATTRTSPNVNAGRGVGGRVNLPS